MRWPFRVPHQRLKPLRVRTILPILAVTLAVTAMPLASAQASKPDFVYGGAEVTRWWNEHHDPNIRLEQGRQAAAYFNGLVVAYLRAVERAQLIWHWAGVARCESGGDPTTNTGNSYFGAYQFSLSTWRSVGGAGYPHQASLLEQTRRAEALRIRSGLGQWPVCGARYR